MTQRRLPCGTRAAYRRHLQRGQVPCKRCLAANAAASRNHRRRQLIGEDMAELIGLLHDLIEDDYRARQRARYAKAAS